MWWCTGVPEDMLNDVGSAITTLPEGFNAHRQIQKVYAARKEMVSSPESLVDWGMAEALAFGTLVAEGNHVRLSGQVRPSPVASTPLLPLRVQHAMSIVPCAIPL